MGREKKYTTASEIAKQKKTYREKHNAHRRAKYETDAEYRERIGKVNRERYRDETGAKPRKVMTNTEIRRLSRRMAIEEDNGSLHVESCLDVSTLADALGGYNRCAIHRWQREGRFPRGRHVAVCEVSRVIRGRKRKGLFKQNVFLLSEALEIAVIFREHLQDKLYFTAADTEVVAKLMEI